MLCVSCCGNSACWCGDGMCVVGNVTVVVVYICGMGSSVVMVVLCVHGWVVVGCDGLRFGSSSGGVVVYECG